MEVLGVIPARGGSKSTPRKNLYPLCGRPLIAYTFDAAKASQRLKRVILSTDDGEIAALGREHDIEVPFIRPARLAQDDTPMLPVIQHAIHYLASEDGYCPDVIVLLQPTSPLRRAEHIDAAVDILIETGADSVVSVVEVPHNFSPISVMRIVEGRLEPFISQEEWVLRRQDKPQVYARNGPAVCALTYETLMKGSTLFGEDCRPYLMATEDSVDIDTLQDIAYATFLLRCRVSERI